MAQVKGFAKSKIPSTAEKESIKLKENADMGFTSKMRNAAKESAVNPS